MKIPGVLPPLKSFIAERPLEAMQVLSWIQATRLDPAPGGRYRHWETLRHLTPPAGLSVEQWWYAIKWARGVLLKKLPLLDVSVRPFQYAVPDAALRLIHEIDRNAIGRIALTEPVMNPATRGSYIVHS